MVLDGSVCAAVALERLYTTLNDNVEHKLKAYPHNACNRKGPTDSVAQGCTFVSDVAVQIAVKKLIPLGLSALRDRGIKAQN